MNEQEVLDAFERGKAFGFAEGMKSMRLKELTDGEMRKVINEIVDGVTVSEMVTFLTISRAILRKAQEK